jgi:hypothetical protein
VCRRTVLQLLGTVVSCSGGTTIADACQELLVVGSDGLPVLLGSAGAGQGP